MLLGLNNACKALANVAQLVEALPVIERLKVWFPVRAHCKVASSVPGWVLIGGNLSMLLSLFLLSLLFLKEIFFKCPQDEDNNNNYHATIDYFRFTLKALKTLKNKDLYRLNQKEKYRWWRKSRNGPVLLHMESSVTIVFIWCGFKSHFSSHFLSSLVLGLFIWEGNSQEMSKN